MEAVARRQLLNVCHRFVEFFDKSHVARRSKDLHERAVVPKGAVAATLESIPDGFADIAVVPEDGPGVVNLVRAGDELDRGRCRR